jgi:propanol-preferring alcohol dehydrogenase
MKAYRFTQWLKSAELVEVAVPEPGLGEALVRIGGSGACHSDLHIMHEWTPETFSPVADWKLPFTLGHENAGWIEGGESIGLDIGTPVVVSPTWSCGICRACRSGATNYCETEPALSGGLGRDGGVPSSWWPQPTA